MATGCITEVVPVPCIGRETLPLGGDPGVHRTMNRLLETFWWPSIRKDTADFVWACQICQFNARDPGKSTMLRFFQLLLSKFTSIDIFLMVLTFSNNN